MDWAFLAIGGFLLGAFFYTGYYTVRFEPEVKIGYAVVGVGILASVAINTYVDFTRDVDEWARALVLLAYISIAAGLVLITRARRRANRK